METNAYGSEVPDDAQFSSMRARNREQMGRDRALRETALALQGRAEAYAYGYQQEWCGVPVIRLPDDIVVLQEIVWQLKPRWVIETGVARGGGLVLSASLMAMAQIQPRVLGIDIQILPHAHTSVTGSPFAAAIRLWEGDSAGVEARDVARQFIQDCGGDAGLLVLDSNHTHEHVSAELESLWNLLPIGSLILVADTLIEELPAGHYPDRPWDKGNNPMTAVKEFLDANADFRLSPD